MPDSAQPFDRDQTPIRGVWRASLLRIIVPAVLTPALFLTMVFLVALPDFERDMRIIRQENARNQVQAAVSLLASYDAQVEAGELTLAEARTRAMQRLRAVRYGPDGRDYFWINDLEPVVLMHPYMTEIEGSDIFNIPDREGRPLLYAFLEIVQSPERGGFCYYKWQDREKRTEPQDKISYVQLYEPWGWIVGSGVYLADVDARVAEMTRTMVRVSLLILAAILAISFFVADSGVRRERLRLLAEREVQARQRILQGLVDNVRQFVGLLSPSGELLLCNRPSRVFIGVANEDVIGRPFRETAWWTHSPALQEELGQAIERCREQAEPQKFEAWHLGLQGERIEVTVFLSPILSPEGAVHSIVVEGRDMTAINRATAALREREEDLETILNSIHDGVIAMDPDGRVRRVNAVARGLLRVPESLALGRPLSEVLDATGQDGRPLDEALADILDHAATRQPWPAQCVNQEGVTAAVEFLGAMAQDADGRVTGNLVVIRDRTEEEELRRQLFQAQKLEAIGRLAGGVAHDFNNLLTGILGNAELIKASSPGEPAVTAPADEIVEASTRAADLTNQLLAFSRKGKFQNAPVDVHDVVRKVMALLQRSIDKRITLRDDLAAERSVVSGDASQLYNALLNLGLNARDAMPEGGTLTLATRTIEVTGDGPDPAPGPYLLLTVTDSGLGMSEEVRRRIFEPFFTTKPRGEGTGLGLAGVYGCVVNHLGSIEVESAPGQGTTFSIQLPLTELRAEPAPGPARGELPRGDGLILVVDDEEHIRRFATRALERYGYRVVACADGLAAESYFREHAAEVDLVILDLIMPNLSGEETFTRLRGIDPDVRVVLASGYSQNEAVESLLRRGASGFLPKPYRLDDLTRAVSEQLT